MIKSTMNKPNWLIAIGIPLFIFSICFFITLTSKFKANNALISNAILIDILLVAPLIYFLAIRNSNVSKLTVLRVFIVGLLVAGLILNTHSNNYLQFIKIWVSPIIEALFIFFVINKFYLANKRARNNENKIDFLIHCRKVMLDVIGNQKFANIISSEISVLYYIFFGRKDKTIDYQTKFTSYKENGVLAVLWIFLFLFLVETTSVHLLLNLWNNTIAWVFTGLSLYTCLQLYAHINAIKARPIVIKSYSFEIHNGLSGDAFIDFKNVEKFEHTEKMPLNCNLSHIALIKGVENHNMVIYLKTPIVVTKVFGIEKITDTIIFYVDRPKEFFDSLTLKLEAQKLESHQD